jgi:hypothetical protein
MWMISLMLLLLCLNVLRAHQKSTPESKSLSSLKGHNWSNKNRHFKNPKLPLHDHDFFRDNVEGEIVVFSVWVGDNPINTTVLNHQIFCDHHGYEYRHFYLPTGIFIERYGDTPFAWYSVMMANELLQMENSTFKYLLKLDIDCVFARMDLPLESIIDPYDRYSVYLSQSSLTSRFTSSHTWLVRKDSFALDFLNEWLQFGRMGKCNDLAYEQGALQLTTAYFYHRKFFSHNVTKFTCIRYCFTRLSSYNQHQCPLWWLDENGFGYGWYENLNGVWWPEFVNNHTAMVMRDIGGGAMTHPNIFTNPIESFDHYHSPVDGYSFEVGDRVLDKSKVQALVIHPCKRSVYIHPDQVREHCIAMR